MDSIRPPPSSDQDRLQHNTEESTGRFVCQSFDRLVPPVVTSAQYCCLVSESMCANPPSTRAFIRDLCTELHSRWRGGLRLANCFARFHQLSHCTTMFALDGQSSFQTNLSFHSFPPVKLPFDEQRKHSSRSMNPLPHQACSVRIVQNPFCLFPVCKCGQMPAPSPKASSLRGPSPLSLLHQRHQQVHRFVRQLSLGAPHGQIVDHFLQKISHNPLSPLGVCAKRCTERNADLRREERDVGKGEGSCCATAKPSVTRFRCGGVSDLLIQLFVHQQVRLGPASEEPHDVFSHLRAQQLRQAGSGGPGLDL